jgi:ABC-type branched-subunit amino acid transport system permease subunit
MTGAALATARRARRLRPSREVVLPALTFLAFALLPLFAPRHRFRGRSCRSRPPGGLRRPDFIRPRGVRGAWRLCCGNSIRPGIDVALVSLPVAIAVTMLFAWLTGIVCLRTKGAYFVMITHVFGQMIYFIATSLAPYGGDNGLTIAARNSVAGLPLLKRDHAFYYVALMCLLAAYLFCRALVASRFGPLLVLVVLFACGGLIGLSARLWRWFGHA